jgi:osmotically-inducible protein OsmY
MGKLAIGLTAGLWTILAMSTSGCSQDDTQRLARIGRKVAARAQAMSASTGDRLHTGWQSFRANLDDSGLDARVATRLRWDKSLADTPIQVEVRGGIVILRGSVAALEQRQRAVALAKSTVGVEDVEDNLEMPKTE